MAISPSFLCDWYSHFDQMSTLFSIRPSNCWWYQWCLRIIFRRVDFHAPFPHADPVAYCRTDSRLAPSQWETSLQSNAVSHWLGAKLESDPVAFLHLVVNLITSMLFLPKVDRLSSLLLASLHWRLSLWQSFFFILEWLELLCAYNCIFALIVFLFTVIQISWGVTRMDCLFLYKNLALEGFTWTALWKKVQLFVFESCLVHFLIYPATVWHF